MNEQTKRLWNDSRTKNEVISQGAYLLAQSIKAELEALYSDDSVIRSKEIEHSRTMKVTAYLMLEQGTLAEAEAAFILAAQRGH